MVNFNLVHGYVKFVLSCKAKEDKKLLSVPLNSETHMNFSRYYIRDYLKLLSDENFSFDRKTLL